MTYHNTINIVIKTANVDELMVPLVDELNRLNAVTTLHCCQGESYEPAYLHLFVNDLQCPIFQEVVTYFAINENAQFESSLCIRSKHARIDDRMLPHIKGTLVIRFPHDRITEVTKNVKEIVGHHQKMKALIADLGRKVVVDEKASSLDKPLAKDLPAKKKAKKS